MKNKGYTLIEILLIMLVLIVIFLLSIPIVLKIIDMSKINAYKSSALSVFDSVEFYIANNKFIELSDNGIQIENNKDLKIKNNNFDKGLMIKNKEGKLELVYLIRDNYCAKGTEKQLKVSNKGCGFLDETEPDTVEALKFSSTKSSITLFAKVKELESEIVNYYYSIDDNEYIKSTSNKYTFNDIEGEHKFKIKVENEAGLTKESDIITLSTLKSEQIICNIEGEKISSSKTLNCTYPLGDNYVYEYKLNGDYIKIDSNILNKEFTENQKITLRVLDDNNEIAKLSVDIKNIDNVLNGSYPKLLNNMIPVIYDENKKAYIKVDDDTKYWDYQNRIWANAVIVKKYKDSSDSNSRSRDYYFSEEANNKAIYENDIIAPFVWIPRFKYKLFNVQGLEIEPQVIDIQFGNTYENPKMVKNLYHNGDYIIHPAFIFGNKSIQGFWVSKYNASYDVNSECYKYKDEKYCNKDDDSNLYFLPNVDPITNISISNAFNLSLKLKDNSLYSLNGNTHLMKNTEWGAIAYLSNSIYGIGNLEQNRLGTTNGNNTGIFDINSSIYQMVMGNYNNDAGLSKVDNSGFEPLGKTPFPSSEYYDLYTSISLKGMILGDATGEVAKWNSSLNQFVDGNNPFFIRGGNSEFNTSIYSFGSYSGKPNDNITFRVVVNS